MEIHAVRSSTQFRTLMLAAALGCLSAACAGTGAESLDDSIELDDVAASQQELRKVSADVSTAATSGSVAIKDPPVIKDPGTIVVYFQCGWDSSTLSSQCTCRGDDDCNRMFSSGFCGARASCDTGAGTCKCDLKL